MDTRWVKSYLEVTRSGVVSHILYFIRYLLFFVMTYFSYEKNTSDDAAVSKSSFLYWQDLLYIPLLPSKFIFLYFAVVAHHACVWVARVFDFVRVKGGKVRVFSIYKRSWELTGPHFFVWKVRCVYHLLASGSFCVCVSVPLRSTRYTEVYTIFCTLSDISQTVTQKIPLLTVYCRSQYIFFLFFFSFQMVKIKKNT